MKIKFSKRKPSCSYSLISELTEQVPYENKLTVL